ncbi:15128_t:CDS:2 [Dentiscutata erythropus]|uniref:15128_t:CDS:1 n=1 Tax=Dentiscutata erythropus TaxID=1348616 RepID=A0A9N9G1Y9_9GLOM|nr:15128_t:CDS:2 [Dentiscutata erythropus]
MEKRLSEIPEPKQSNRRLSVVSNSDTAKPENNSSFHTYVVSPVQTFFHSHVVRPSKETPLVFYSVLLILLSILLLLVLLLGSSKTIYLSKFTFDEPIKFITHKSDIIFTLYGHCVDDSCTTPSLVNNFDKLPSSSDITAKSSSNQKRLDIPTPSIPTPSIPDIPSSVEPAVSAVSSDVTNAANTAASTAADIAAKAPGLLSELLSAFDNFKPRSPTANISGFFSIPYLIALIFNVISLPLLYFHFTIIAALLILSSTILNTIACFFDLLLFVWVFDLISIIPGIGSQNTGPGIYLATMSASFLTVATILLCISSCSSAIKSTSKCLKKLRKTKVNDAEKGDQYPYF